MRKILLFIYGTLIVEAAYTQNGLPATSAASIIPIEDLSVAHWQADLSFLQETIHRDYPFLFRKTSAEVYDAEVEKLNKAMPSMALHERILGFHKIMSLLKYGHTRMATEALHLNSVWHRLISIGLAMIYVEAVEKNYVSIVGAKLIKVEGMPVRDALEAVRPINSVENEQKFKQDAINYLTNSEILHAQGITKELKTAINYTSEKDGKMAEEKVTVIDASQIPENYDYNFKKPNENWVSVRDKKTTPNYLKNRNKNYYFEYLPKTKTMYVRYSEVNNDPNETIEMFFKKVFQFVDKNEIEKFILDLRLPCKVSEVFPLSKYTPVVCNIIK